jgi:hypothetical protein
MGKACYFPRLDKYAVLIPIYLPEITLAELEGRRRRVK